jgi:hypothetical protein
MSQMNFENPLDLINFVLKKRSEPQRKQFLEGEIPARLNVYLLVMLFGSDQISGPIFYFSETKAKSIVIDEGQNTLPYLVEYGRDETDFWRITSIKQTCLGCFGTGILSDIEICSVCLGEGWTEF